MAATIHAFFENGVFRPVEPIAVPERTLVEIDVRMCEEPSTPLQVPEGPAEACSLPGERDDSGVARRRGSA